MVTPVLLPGNRIDRNGRFFKTIMRAMHTPLGWCFTIFLYSHNVLVTENIKLSESQGMRVSQDRHLVESRQIIVFSEFPVKKP